MIGVDKINVSLIDTAHPSRGQNRGVATAHDNVAIVDLRPSSRVVAEGLDVDFTVTIVNFGKSEKVVVELLKVGPDWRIADIQWDDASTLRGLFRKK